MLEISRLTTRYGGIVAVDDISLSMAEGQAFAIIGANGAGKTSLLRTISGLLRPANGQITFAGMTLTGRPAYAVARQGILMVPEGRQIFGALTVEENLRLGQRAAAARSSQPNDEMNKVFALFPILAERRSQYAGQLSGGQQQMLAIGRAMMGRPRLLLLDEPSLGLGPSVVAQVFAALKALHQEGLGMILVEQNARLALEATEFAFVMERGRIVHQGPSVAMRSDPLVIDHYLGRAAGS
jgi:branched-chain amino acid transport system ATP-binding protein